MNNTLRTIGSFKEKSPPEWCQNILYSGNTVNFFAEIPDIHRGKARLARRRIRRLADYLGTKVEPVTSHSPMFQVLKSKFGNLNENCDSLHRIKLIRHESQNCEETGYYLISSWNQGGRARIVAFRLHSAPRRGMWIESITLVNHREIRRQMEHDDRAMWQSRTSFQGVSAKIVWLPRQTTPSTPRSRRVVFSRTPGESNSDDDGDGDGPRPNPSILLKLKGGAQ